MQNLHVCFFCWEGEVGRLIFVFFIVVGELVKFVLYHSGIDSQNHGVFAKFQFSFSRRRDHSQTGGWGSRRSRTIWRRYITEQAHGDFFEVEAIRSNSTKKVAVHLNRLWADAKKWNSGQKPPRIELRCLSCNSIDYNLLNGQTNNLIIKEWIFNTN